MKPDGFQEITAQDSPEKRVGVGILGYGFMGKVHSNALLKIPYTYQQPPALPVLVAMGGRNASRVRDTARRFGYPGIYTDWEKMVRDPDIEVFDNCTPDDQHAGPSIAAAQEGKHVLCEKPMALTAQEARKMWQEAEHAGIKHMCCFNYRFVPAVRLARRLLEEKALGTIYQFRVRYMQEAGRHPATALENIWYASGTASGVLLGIGSHALDMARFLVGDITSISGLKKTFNPVRRTLNGKEAHVSTDEGNMALLEFADGAVGTMESSAVSPGRKNQLTWEINGSKGSMKFDLEDLNHLYVCLEDTVRLDVRGFTKISVTSPEHPLQCLHLPPGHNSGWEYSHIHALAHFLDCVANDKPVAPYGATFHDGYVVQAIMEAIGKSMETGQRIDTTTFLCK